jgi:hypothetical protein
LWQLSEAGAQDEREDAGDQFSLHKMMPPLVVCCLHLYRLYAMLDAIKTSMHAQTIQAVAAEGEG